MLCAAVLLAAGLAACTPKSTSHQRKATSVGMIVWLDVDVTAPQKVAIEAKVRGQPGVAGVACLTGEQVYARFKGEFRETPDLVASVDPADLPASCEFTLPDRAAADRASVELGALPGVDVAKPLAAPTAAPSPTR